MSISVDLSNRHLNPYHTTNTQKAKQGQLHTINVKDLRDTSASIVVNGKSFKLNDPKTNPLLSAMQNQTNNNGYDNILKKLENGSDLSIEELSYLQQKDPELYRQVMQEIQEMKQFETKLKNCDSKEAVTECYLQQKLATATRYNCSGDAETLLNEQNKLTRIMNRINNVFDKHCKATFNDSSTHVLNDIASKQALNHLNVDPNNKQVQSKSTLGHYDELV